MRKILISLATLITLILIILLVAPLFLSTDLLKSQVQQFVKDQSGMTLDIRGPVSLSLITGLDLSAQDVSLTDPQDNPLFDVEELDFSLALSPLLSGQADIRAITLHKPTFTLAASTGTKSAARQVGDDPIRALATQEAPPSPSAPPKAEGGDIDLSALHIQRLSMRGARLLSQKPDGKTEILLSDLNADLSIPDFSGPATLEGSLSFQGTSQSFTGSIGHAGNAINGKPTSVNLTLASDTYRAQLRGDLAHKNNPLFVANVGMASDKLPQLLASFNVAPSPVGAQNLSAQASLIVGQEEVQLRSIKLSLDDQSLSAAARIFTGPTLEKPLIRLAIDAGTLNLDRLLAQPVASGEQAQTQSAGDAGNASTAQSPKAPSSPPDLSALNSFNATLDFRAQKLITQGISISRPKLLANLIEGQLDASLKHAAIAKGTVRANLSGDLANALWSGALKADKLDLEQVALTANQKSPASGMISADLSFAARGLDAQTIQQNGNIAGSISLSKGSFSSPALQAAIANRDSGTLSNINVTAKLNGLDKPMTLTGSMGWNGETIRYDSQIGLAEALAGRSIPASLTMKARPLTASLSGRFSPAQITLNGSQIAISAPSSRALLAWLGQEVGKGTPNMPIALRSNLALSPQKTSLDKLSLTMGPSKGTGTLSVTTSGKPYINANLAFNKLDVTPFLGDGNAKGRSGSAQSGKGSTTKSSPQGGWDKSPIDFSGLNAIDADIKLSTKSLVARDIVTGQVSLTTKLKSGALNASLDQLSLYQGQGTGGISIDGRGKQAKVGANFSLSNMQMAHFLRDAVGLKALSGRGGIRFDLASTGASQAALVSNLGGSSNLEIRDGQIRGINIPQMLRSLQGNILDGWASSPSQSTDFSSLTASFAIVSGIVTNNDLQMLGPLVRLTGAGQIDLPNQRINYKATPKLVTKLRGQGGLVDANGIPIPIIIKGKLAKPRIYPDIPGILENPQAILQGLRNLGGAGKTTAKGLEKLDKNITKELDKQSKKLGIDLNQILRPNQKANPQGQPQQGQPQQQKPQNLEQQLFNNITKGLFGN
ncbi:MAG: AsmA family protein [Cohaesibacter sp.]|jgi:uncharacterized protein involved in outer membrane biogenesis|nr:AsmA family protein [Cohaesibacter sp.]